MLTWKLRITVLWIAAAVWNSVAMILAMFQPGVIRDLMAGEWLRMNAHGAGLQIGLAFGNWLLPMVMAFLTLVLKDPVNRWTNGVLGAVTAAGAIGILTSNLSGMSGGARFVALVGCLVALLIVWHAWRWPRPTDVTPQRQTRETTLR